ncbi:Subtilisin NAT precursor [compost metagenome]
MKLQSKFKPANERKWNWRKSVPITVIALLLVFPAGNAGVLAAVTADSTGGQTRQQEAELRGAVSVTDSTYTPVVPENSSITGERQSRLIIFKEGQFPKQSDELLHKWPEIEVTLLPEAGMLRLTGSSLAELRSAEAEVKLLFAGSIEEAGEDPKLISEDYDASMRSAAGVAGQDLEQLLDRSTVEGSAPAARQYRSFTVANEPDSVSFITKANLYQQWGWDIKEVTGDGQSMSVQAGSHNVVVAVVDSGIDASHPDLSANIVGVGKSFVPGVNDTVDRIGHGTMVAGTIAAKGKLLGVGPDLGLVAYKVFDQGEADSSWVVEAIIQAVRDDVDVINLSLGTYKSLIKSEDQAILLAYARALAYAYLKGVVVVASSGTDGFDISNPLLLARSKGWKNDLAVHAPGGLPGVITVSASNREHERAYYSNYGLLNMIAAPAGDYGSTWFTKGELNLLSMCLTTYPTQLPQSYLSQLVGLPAGYEFMIGTSLAAPKVSAAAALLIAEGREKGVRMTPDKVKQTLFKSATDYGIAGPDPDFGVGVVNVRKALKSVSR